MVTRSPLMTTIVFGCLGLLTVAVIVASIPRPDGVGELDAVIVLGGGGVERLTLGLTLAAPGELPVVLSAEGIAQGRARGLRCDREVYCLRPDPSTTAGEAAAMHALAEREGWERIGVATSSFHVNRSRTLFRQCFGDRVAVAGAPGTATAATAIHRGVRETVGHAAALTVRRAC